MNSKEYIAKATRTESRDFDKIGARLSSERNQRLLHAGIGLATESGELLDTLKKHLFYGKPLDTVNLREELGDLFWYCALIADELDFDFETVMANNIEKLQKRYGEAFSEERANERNLIAERELLNKQAVGS